MRNLVTNMKKDIDYIYEFSDLNWMHTRVKILTGELKGLIFEIGSSQANIPLEGQAEMKLEYTLYSLPENVDCLSKLSQSDFDTFISDRVMDIFFDRENDKENHTKLLQQAALGLEFVTSNINIDAKFYPRGKQKTITGLQSI